MRAAAWRGAGAAGRGRPRGPRRPAWPRSVLLGAAFLGTAGALLASPSPAAAQDRVLALASACAAGQEALFDPCLETVLAAQAAQGLIGLAASGGAPLEGSSSTLGKRFDGVPRFGFGVQGGLVRASVPDALGPATGPAPEAGAVAPSVRATAAAGLFQGFSTAPTVGGILSFDLLASYSYVSLPGDRGYRDGSSGLGLGARLGVVRESFTLPGITVSATRRWMSEVRLTEQPDGDGTRADVDAVVTSFRGEIGKTLANVDVLVGVGWDRYGGDLDVRVRPQGGGGPEGRTVTDAFESDRVLFYGGVGYTFLVYQLSAEAGFARGFDVPPDRGLDGYDPTSGSPFLRVGFRLSY